MQNGHNTSTVIRRSYKTKNGNVTNTSCATVEALNRNIVRSAMTAPYLQKEEELDLILRWKGERDNKALTELVRAHMRLVISISSKFKHYNLPMTDLVQEGCVGLLEAAERFDTGKEVRFSTYATWWVRASIQDYILRNWSIVRGGTSSAQKSLFFNLRTAWRTCSALRGLPQICLPRRKAPIAPLRKQPLSSAS